MTDPLPTETPELEPAATFDSARLIAEVRRGDPAAIEEAYRVTFGHALGRTVLLHALAVVGEIGKPRGPESREDANHINGRGYAVLEIARLAGFDPVAISAAGLTQLLEGAPHEHGFGHHPHHAGGPRVDFGDDPFTGGAGDPDDPDAGTRADDPGGAWPDR